jgi:hypothetical protein
MGFPDNHYTRAWKLLACVADEWATIRVRFNLGSKATREQIEEVWDAMFNADPADWPCIRRVHGELMRDEALARHLHKCWWEELHPWELKGYEFEEIRPVVLTRLWWQVVRNAEKWLRRQGELTHWARFWNTRNLTEELRRAIKDMEASEGSSGVQPPKDPGRDDRGQNHEPEQGYRGKRGEEPSALLAEMMECCRSDDERALIRDWLILGGEYTEAEEEEIARRHNRNREQLNALLSRIIRELRHKGRGPDSGR